MSKDRRPVLVGAGQFLQRDVEPLEALDPVSLMAVAARRAAEDAGCTAALLERADAIAVVDVFAWRARNPVRLLSEVLGAAPAREILSTVGGNTPQALVNRLCDDIGAGRCDIAIIAGANAAHTMQTANKASLDLGWPAGGEGTPESFGDPRPGSSDYENNHGLYLPANIYPLFENALRAARGLDIETHSLRMASLFHEFSRVAASNPYSWFPSERRIDEIANPGDGNRMVAFPYTKFMNAVMATDQSAALILTSADRARELEIREDRWVYFLGGGDAYEDPWFFSERPSFTRCPAMRAAGDHALARSGLAMEEIDFIDFYSCFPVAVEMACLELGVAEDDPRGLTVTGGLPFFGGPGNNYSTHAIATMMQRLRERPEAKGLVTANGWYLTKHAAGVYSGAPPKEARPPAGGAPGNAHDAAVELVIDPSGRGSIETYTVLYGRDGAPRTGVVVGRLDDDRRFLAQAPAEPALLAELVASEAVGRTGKVTSAGVVNSFVPD